MWKLVSPVLVSQRTQELFCTSSRLKSVYIIEPSTWTHLSGVQNAKFQKKKCTLLYATRCAASQFHFKRSTSNDWSVGMSKLLAPAPRAMVWMHTLPLQVRPDRLCSLQGCCPSKWHLMVVARPPHRRHSWQPWLLPWSLLRCQSWPEKTSTDGPRKSGTWCLHHSLRSHHLRLRWKVHQSGQCHARRRSASQSEHLAAGSDLHASSFPPYERAKWKYVFGAW